MWVRVYFDCPCHHLAGGVWRARPLYCFITHLSCACYEINHKETKSFNGRKGSWAKPLCQIDRGFEGEVKFYFLRPDKRLFTLPSRFKLDLNPLHRHPLWLTARHHCIGLSLLSLGHSLQVTMQIAISKNWDHLNLTQIQSQHNWIGATRIIITNVFEVNCKEVRSFFIW